MRYEPRVDREHLAQAVHIEYGLPVDRAEFVPLGYATACYALRCPSGARYFAKLWPRWQVDEPVDSAGGQRLVPRQDGLLRLVSQLRHMCGARIAHQSGISCGDWGMCPTLARAEEQPGDDHRFAGIPDRRCPTSGN